MLLDGKLQEYQAAFQQADSSGNGKLGACRGCTRVCCLMGVCRPALLLVESLEERGGRCHRLCMNTSRRCNSCNDPSGIRIDKHHHMSHPTLWCSDSLCLTICPPMQTGATEVRALFASLGHKLSDQKLFDVMERCDQSDQVSKRSARG